MGFSSPGLSQAKPSLKPLSLKPNLRFLGLAWLGLARFQGLAWLVFFDWIFKPGLK